MMKAIEILGDEIPQTPQMWLGYGAHILSFPIANGTLFNGTLALLLLVI
jgi:salicylate hydroxylase